MTCFMGHDLLFLTLKVRVSTRTIKTTSMKLEDLIYNAKMVSFSDYQKQSLERQLRVFKVPSYTLSSELVNVIPSFIRTS